MARLAWSWQSVWVVVRGTGREERQRAVRGGGTWGKRGGRNERRGDSGRKRANTSCSLSPSTTLASALTPSPQPSPASFPPCPGAADPGSSTPLPAKQNFALRCTAIKRQARSESGTPTSRGGYPSVRGPFSELYLASCNFCVSATHGLSFFQRMIFYMHSAYDGMFLHDYTKHERSILSNKMLLGHVQRRSCSE